MIDEPFSAFQRGVVRKLRGARGRDRIVEELLDHLEQAAHEEEQAGADPAAAHRRAVERFGDVDAIAAAFPQSRMTWIPSLVALVATVALVAVSFSVAADVARPCGGVRHVSCVSTVPFGGTRQLHPLRARLDAAAAMSAALLATGLGALAWREHRRRRRGFDAAIAQALGDVPVPVETLPRRPGIAAWAAAGLLGLVIATAAAAHVRGVIERYPTPRERAYPLQHVTALPTRTPILVGTRRAQPLLRWILHQMPTNLASVGVKPAGNAGFRGRLLIATVPPHLAAGAATETQWESDVIAHAYQHSQRRPRWSGAPPITGALTDTAGGGIIHTGTRYYTPAHAAALRTTILTNARQAGLTPITLDLPTPDGVAPILIARTAHPSRYQGYAATVFPKERFIGTLLVIESRDGYVRAIVGAVPHTEYTWADQRPQPHRAL